MDKKTRRSIILSGIGLLLLAGLTGLIRCLITGYDILAWFTSKTAFVVYFLLMIYIGFVLYVLLKFKR